MPYDDDDDLFGEEFDFVDDDDSVEEGSELEDEKPKAKPTKKRPAAKDKDKEKAEKPAARAPKRPRSTSKPAAEKSAPKREPRREESEPRAAEPRPIPKLPAPADKKPFDSAPVGYLSFAQDDDLPFEEESADGETESQASAPSSAPVPAEPAGPPADHLVHVYEYGKFKRTIARKFTDEQAVGFAEEYTRTGKPYGRYAIATPDDEEPSPTFSGASKGE